MRVARLLSIDYGKKRVGIAVSDPLQIIATGLDTVANASLLDFLTKYVGEEEVETIIIGEPLHQDGTPTFLMEDIQKLILKLNQQFPSIEVVLQDERFTSKDAKRILLESGAKKKKRRDKSLIDKISAVLILQDYMEKLRNNKL